MYNLYIDSTHSKMDNFETSTKCPSKSDVCLIESQKMQAPTLGVYLLSCLS